MEKVVIMFCKYIYLLEHIRVLEYDDAKCPIRDRKRLGFFSTRKGAMEVISLLAMRPGFSKYPNDFVIKMIKLNTKNLKSFNKKNLKIYSVEHEYYKADEDCVWRKIRWMKSEKNECDNFSERRFP